MTFAGRVLGVFSRFLLLVCLAVLMQFLAGLDRVQALWHQRTPLMRARLAGNARPHVTPPG